jgi:hypothetical protein
MLTYLWDFGRLSKKQCNMKQRSRDIDPLFRDFWVLGLCNRYGNVIPWVYPCLGPLL